MDIASELQTHPLILVMCGNNALSEEQPVVFIKLQVLFRITAGLFVEELQQPVAQHPTQLSETKIWINKT